MLFYDPEDLSIFFYSDPPEIYPRAIIRIPIENYAEITLGALFGISVVVSVGVPSWIFPRGFLGMPSKITCKISC